MRKTYINKLRLKDFKSFSKPTVLDLGPGFNCVMGPNGSGKSNILDSLCFVLGRLSTKSIRAENYSDLIHTSKSKQAQTSEVAIRLDNRARGFPIDSDIIEISRSILKSGQTVYRINGKRATRNQVLELLAMSKITPEGHNIILQGDVEKFVSMSPVSKRQLIEEVAGIWVYESKKDSAIKELKKVDEKLREVQIVMTEKGSYMKSLESDKQTAEKYRSYQNELEQAKVSGIKIKLSNLNERKSAVAKKLGKIEEKNKHIEDKAEAAKEKLETLESRLESVEKEIEGRGGEAQLELQRSVERLKDNIENGKSIVKSSENEIKRIDVRKKQLQNNLEDLNKKVKEKEKFISSLRKDKEQLNARESAIKKSVGLSDKDLENLDQVLENKEKEVEILNKELIGIKEGINNKLAEIKIIDFKLEQSDGKLKEFSEKEEQVREIQSDKDRYKQVILEINKILSEDSKLTSDVQNIRVKLNDKEDISARLRSNIRAAQDLIMRDRAISRILSSKNKVEGIFGTVAELGRLEPKLKDALSVAAGGRMRNIVVDNENTAINCLNLLRESRSGVATFLPLNKIKTTYTSAGVKIALSKKGVVGLASELISCDPKFKVVFQHIFRNTLIVENSSVAKSLGIGKYNMVTLDGDLFGSSGAITGGFRREGTGISFVEKDAGEKLDSLLTEITSLNKEIKLKDKEKHKLEKSLFSLRSEKAELEAKIGIIEDMDLDPDSVKKEKTDFLNDRKELQKIIGELEKEEKSLSSKIESKTIERNSIRSKSKELKFGKKKRELDELESKISTLESKISVEGSTLENSLQRDKKDIARVLISLAKEREEFVVQIKSEEDNAKKNRTLLTAKEKEEKEVFGKLQKLFSEKSKLSEQIKNRNKQYMDIRESLLGEDEEKNALTISNAKIDAELSAAKEDLEPIKNVKILAHIKTIQEAKKRQSELRKNLDGMGNVNMRALEIYDGAKKEFEKLQWRVNKLDEEKSSIGELLDRIESEKIGAFMETFTKVNEHFSKTFKRVTENMIAKLSLENEQSPFEGGLRVEITGLNKEKKSVFSLSGGEKTLTALSFIFAIQSFDPAPFYLLDEIDAALDKVNSEKVAELLNVYSKHSQVVLITHNDAIMNAADNIYGVYKTKEGSSGITSLRV